ncbi:MAG: ATP-binding protein [Deltaproteobacteria bacterium]|nr:ATP-binding protein [Deltaproteobacteria bacterium]MBT4264093.1 ATP-binding protein [Deltaproteobacteria bacterium]MBT7153833.1 ATP-binding protein [Deltaproteobacteria bacterium]MBT7711397.1 ATP-binding protein [Deltaproteobacteria bacterium]
MEIIARKKEKQILQSVLTSESSELVAIYGRRRIGKTYLVRNFFESCKSVIYFELTGQKRESGEYAPIKYQLANFSYQFERSFGRGITVPNSWQNAFVVLRKEVERLKKTSSKLVLFFDELPWLCTPRSGFFEALDQAWNTTFERQPNVKVIVCGSAASWMLKKLIHAKAGFSRRITHKIRLSPFSLEETEKYLSNRGFDLSLISVAEVYMLLGGIPYYLNFLSPQKSIYQNIEDECFDINGRLVDEYDLIFSSLFKNSEGHKKVTEFVAARQKGVLLKELTNKFQSFRGGSMARILDNLVSSSFIRKEPPLYNENKGAVYRLEDEFVLFYLKWIKSAPRSIIDSPNTLYFQNQVQGNAYKSWRGFAFERLCRKHEYQIRQTLGIHKILSMPSTVYFYDSNGKRSSQIDLLFERADNVISICEMKYCEGEYELSKSDINDLVIKKEDLRRYLTSKKKARKDIHICYVTPNGVNPNKYFHQLQPSMVTLEDLFQGK